MQDPYYNSYDPYLRTSIPKTRYVGSFSPKYH